MGKSLRSKEHKALRAVLVEAREAKGLTQEKLAQRLGKPQSFVWKIESGERRCDVPEFIRIARAMKIDPEALFRKVVRW